MYVFKGSVLHPAEVKWFSGFHLTKLHYFVYVIVCIVVSKCWQ